MSPNSSRRAGWRRRDVLRHAGTGVTAAALAGCQSGGQDTAGSDQRGTVVDTDRFEDDPFTIGLLAVDDVTPAGKGMINSMDLAVREVNESGGVLGGDVEYVVGKTKLQAVRAKQHNREFVLEEDVDVTMGVALTIRSLMPVIAQHETLHITTGAPHVEPAELVSRSVSATGADPQEEYEKYKYHFRYGPPNVDQLLDGLVEFLDLYVDDLGWESAAVLIENVSIVEDAEEKVARAAEDYIDLPIVKRVSGSISDWTPVWDNVENEGVDVALVGFALAGVSAITQWASQERPFELGGAIVRAMSTDFWDQTDGACQGVWTGNAVTPLSQNTPRTQPYIQAYDRAYGGAPPFTGPLTYDAVKLYAQAVRETGSRDPEVLIPYLEEELHFTDGTIMNDPPGFRFQGADARYAHDPVFTCIAEDTCGEEATGVPLFQQWQEGPDGGGRMEVFAPEVNRTADYVKPPWLR
jgi:branched-chain amino acid transport system substrate-binding protein